jgi:hypothetical protein
MLAIPLTFFKGLKEKTKMQTICVNRQHFNTIAKQGGVMPSYWSAIEISLSTNDRLPKMGSVEDSV